MTEKPPHRHACFALLVPTSVRVRVGPLGADPRLVVGTSRVEAFHVGYLLLSRVIPALDPMRLILLHLFACKSPCR